MVSGSDNMFHSVDSPLWEQFTCPKENGRRRVICPKRVGIRLGFGMGLVGARARARVMFRVRFSVKFRNLHNSISDK